MVHCHHGCLGTCTYRVGVTRFASLAFTNSAGFEIVYWFLIPSPQSPTHNHRPINHSIKQSTQLQPEDTR
jgi:hypothetical protein